MSQKAVLGPHHGAIGHKRPSRAGYYSSYW